LSDLKVEVAELKAANATTASDAEVERLESELKSVKVKLEKAKNEKEDALADLKVGVAELKAGNKTLQPNQIPPAGLHITAVRWKAF
jgi:hypothetical protein